jgi:hypothetical protein
MKRGSLLAVPVALTLALALTPATLAQDEWKFGIGTGISSFSLDGDVGFASPGGGVIFEVDLDNSDTQDLLESGFGLGGFAAKGKWRILYGVGTLTLEDEDGGLEAEWERLQAELAVVYNFGKAGNHAFGVLFGARHTSHDWEFKFMSTSVDFDESWTDGIIGLTHAVPFAEKWSWSNRVDVGGGDSEGSSFFSTSIARRFGERWSANVTLKQTTTEFGERSDSSQSDFYFYDVDEPAIGIGFLYMW